ncbi:WD repeat-containing protein on Y chromosome, partial [Orussus abietinus]|uniref:WD repeat-containing protein on Y chromosome n=1 Tax=Orussus abietinus TaxID=222816 RepID=UPI000C715EDF
AREVTSVVWLENRILCTGWDKRVTEFADTESGIHKKRWEMRHTDDVLCASVANSQTLATASYNGELVLWRLETGQPYRKFLVNNPTGRYTIVYTKESKGKNDAIDPKNMKGTPARKIHSDGMSTPPISSPLQQRNSKHQQSALNTTRSTAVYSMIFLNSRPVSPDVGTLLISLESGLIQVWTHHPAAGFLGAFSVIHTPGDCALCLTTDPNNDYLITGHAAGYIKVWLLTNYALPNPQRISMPVLRLEFPFLWKDRLDGRAKRAVRNQPLPLLLSSIMGHTNAVNSLQFVPGARLIVSGSSDHTVRLWSLSGQYISTLGTFRPWSTLLSDTPVSKYFGEFRLPPDIKRIASHTTMKVMKGGKTEVKSDGTAEDVELSKEVSNQKRLLLYGRRLSSPILGQRYKLAGRSKAYDAPPSLDNSLAYIPVYTHLITHNLEPVRIPQMLSVLSSQKMRLPTYVHPKRPTKGVFKSTSK